MRKTASAFLIISALLLSACGFQLRGTFSGKLPYERLYIDLPESSDVGISLRRQIAALGDTRLAKNKENATAIFQQITDRREKTILSLNTSGQVREFRLQTTYSFRIVDPKGRELVPASDIVLMRDITFNDNVILAKDQEEALLWRDINFDLVSQIMRRLSIVKPKTPGNED